MLFCLLFMMTGFRVILGLRRAEIKSQVRRSLRHRKSNEGLVEFSFDLTHKEKLSRIEWEDNGREFRYNGHLYDVVEQSTKGNRLILLCLPDTREEALIKAYEKMNEEQQGPSRSPSFHLFKLLRCLFFPPAHYGALSLFKESPPLFVRYSYYFLSLYRPVQTPPPRVIAA